MLKIDTGNLMYIYSHAHRMILSAPREGNKNDDDNDDEKDDDENDDEED